MWSRVSLGLVLGGTVGNLIDRLRLGYVTDFIDFGYWPAFNVADSSISVGVAVLIIGMWIMERRAKATINEDADILAETNPNLSVEESPGE